MEASLPNETGAASTGSLDGTCRGFISTQQKAGTANGSSCQIMSPEHSATDGGAPDIYSNTYLGKTSYTNGSVMFPDHTPNKLSKGDGPESMESCQYQSVEPHIAPAYLDQLPQSSGTVLMGNSSFLPTSYPQHVYSQQPPFPTVVSLPSSSCQANRQHPAISSYGQVSAPSKSINCYGRQDAVCQDQNVLYDYPADPGYSSHSTESSSCQGHDKDSQGSGSGGGLGSQLELNVGGVACWQMDGGNRVYQHGENELEDLLYHFEKFFQDRFETELKQLRDSVHYMIAEQQTHVRQIVHRAMAEHHSQTSSDELIDDTSAPAASTDNAVTTVDGSHNSGSSNDREVTIHPLTSMILSTMGPTRASLAADSKKKQAHLELMALSCSVSTLLTRTVFRS